MNGEPNVIRRAIERLRESGQAPRLAGPDEGEAKLPPPLQSGPPPPVRQVGSRLIRVNDQRG